MDVPNDQTWVAAYFVKTRGEIIRVRGGECEGIARTGVPCRERHQGTASCMLGSVEAKQVDASIAEAHSNEIVEKCVRRPRKALVGGVWGVCEESKGVFVLKDWIIHEEGISPSFDSTPAAMPPV